MKKEIYNYIFIVIAGMLYALGTILFIFPHSLLLGGTSGISVIITGFFDVSPGNILMIINFTLIILAFIILGKTMAIKTLVGSSVTTLFVGILENVLPETLFIGEIYLSAILGAVVIAVASGVLFYVGSSSGGTDIIALIVKKFTNMNIGKALLVTDCLIVIVGGALGGIHLFIASLIGLLIKTFGIDLLIAFIKGKRNETGIKSN